MSGTKEKFTVFSLTADLLLDIISGILIDGRIKKTKNSNNK